MKKKKKDEKLTKSLVALILLGGVLLAILTYLVLTNIDWDKKVLSTRVGYNRNFSTSQTNVKCFSNSKIGDADGNGKINRTDAELIMNVYVGKTKASSDICCIDIDGDGKVTPNDSLLVSKYAAGQKSNETSMIGKACNEIGTVKCYSSSLVGDADGNGKIENSDIEAIMNVYAGKIKLPENICCLDADGDGQVTPGDSLLVGKYLNGEESEALKNVGKKCSELMGIICTDSSKIGDADGNGKIEEKDAQKILEVFVGISSVSSNKCCVDADGDGKVTPSDSLYVLRYVTGDSGEKGDVGKTCK